MKRMYQEPLAKVIKLAYIGKVLTETSTETVPSGPGEPDDARAFIMMDDE